MAEDLILTTQELAAIISAVQATASSVRSASASSRA
jgi:hypothetical protein